MVQLIILMLQQFSHTPVKSGRCVAHLEYISGILADGNERAWFGNTMTFSVVKAGRAQHLTSLCNWEADEGALCRDVFINCCLS